MNLFLQELTGGLPEGAELARLIIRLVAAAVLGAVVGLEREWFGKPAGLRTHMLVSLGAALFVVACLEFEMSASDLSRVIQGLATGIGFLGAGAILKRAQEREISGLTTAAGIWLTAAVGVAVGLGRLGAAMLAVLLTWVILSGLGHLERHMEKTKKNKPPLR
jgi:putative Mg2+ transporter-C (MgtC) family protein